MIFDFLTQQPCGDLLSDCQETVTATISCHKVIVISDQVRL